MTERCPPQCTFRPAPGAPPPCNEAMFRAVVENSPDVIVRYDLEGRRRYVNPAFEAFFGISAEEALGHTVAERSSLDDPEGYQANILAAVGGESRDFEVVTRAFGSPRTYRMRLVPEADDGGEVNGVLAIGHDLTEIIDAQARSSHFFANMPGFAFTFHMTADGHGSFPFASPGIEALYGLKAEEVKEDMAPLHALAHPDDRPRIEAALAETARTLEPFQIEFRIQRPEGEERWIECRSLPDRQPEGTMLWHGIMLDITERKATQQRMERLERAVELSSEPIYLIDDRLRFAYVNTAASRVLGYPPEALLAMGPDDIDPDATPEESARIMAEAPLGETFVFERRHRTRKGALLDVEISATHFEEGGRKFAICVARDITERKRIYATLRVIADPGGDGDFLAALACRLGETLKVDYVVIDRLAEERGIAETVALYAHGEIAPNLRYALRGTPCDNVAGKRDCCYPRGAQSLFPEDALLVEMGVESYAGIPLWDSTGRPLGLIAVMDASPIRDEAAVLQTLRLAAPRAAAELERAASDRRLREREREFRTLAENTPDNIARWDTAGRIRYSNPVHQRTLDRPLPELLGRTHDELFPDGRFAALNRVIAGIVTGGEGTTISRVPVPAEGGETRFHDVKLVPEFDADGRVTGVLGIGRDMTDQYRMQQTLADREQAFRSLAESSPDSIIRYDREQRIVYLNDKLVRDLGLAEAAEVIGRRPNEVWPDGRFAAIDEAARRAIAEGEPQAIEMHWDREPGTPVIGHITVVPERATDGEIIGTLAFGRDITAIREGERRLQHFIDNLPGMAYTFLLTPEGGGRFPYVSASIEEVYGLTPEQAAEDIAPIHELIHPDDRPRVEAAIAESARALSPFRAEYRVHVPGRPECWLEARSAPERQPDGATLWYGLVLDITERKRIEEELRAALEFTEGVINAVPDLLFEMDRDGTYLNVWTRRPELLAAPKEQLLGRPVGEVLSPESAAVALESLREAEEKGSASGHVIRLDPPDGPLWFELSVSREPGGDPEAPRFLVLSRDITERKRQEAETRRLIEILEASIDFIGTADLEGRLTYLNRAARRMVGLPEDADLSALEIADFHPESAVRVIEESALPAAGEHGTWRGENAVRHRDGREIPVSQLIMLHRDETGAPLFLSTIIQDISERKAAEAAREAALDEALRLAHARATFLSQMSHELRTPMNSVLGFAQLLREDAGLGNEARQRVELILTSGDHLLGLINDVLDFAKIEADRIELDPGEIELAPFLATVAAIIRVKAEEKRLAFAVSVEPGLPESLGGDELRLRQVLLNLLGNAIKFTDRGRVELRASRPVPERIRFEVRDSGVGIDADRLATIFDPFEQAGDRLRAAQGTGLGLAISRRLVRLMGGEIEVESRPGEGSRFSFELPLDAAAPPAKSAVIGAALPPPEEPREAPADAVLPTDTECPPSEELDELLQLARRGNPRAVARRAAALADGEPRQRPFADRLAAMARAYDTRAMETYLQQVLQQKPAP